MIEEQMTQMCYSWSVLYLCYICFVAVLIFLHEKHLQRVKTIIV